MAAILQTVFNAIKDAKLLLVIYFLYSCLEKIFPAVTHESEGLTLTAVLISTIMFLFSVILMLLVSHQVQRNVLVSLDGLSQSTRFWGFGRYAIRSLGFCCAILLCMVPFFIVVMVLSSTEMIRPEMILNGLITGLSVTIIILVVVTLVMVRLGPWITAAVDPKAQDWVFTWRHPANKVFYPLLGLLACSHIFHIASRNLAEPAGVPATGLVSLVLLSCLEVVVLVGINVLITRAYIAMVKTDQTL